MMPTKTPRMENLTTRLFPSSLRPVSFKYDTTSGHTPAMFATTSTRPGMERSFVKMALRNAGRDVIQSLVSAPFRRFTTNSVVENGSRLPNTDAAVRWMQRFYSRRPNVGYSTSLARYPLPRELAKASSSTCGPPCRDITDVSGQAASTIFAQHVAFWVVLALNRLNTATQTRRNVDLSHVRTSTEISDPRSSNSMLRFPCVLAQPNTRKRMRGTSRSE